MDTTILEFTDNDFYVGDRITDSLENSISLSWADVVEKELVGSINDKILTGSLTSDEPVEKKLNDISDILKLEVTNLHDLDILEYQTILVNSLRRILKTDNIDKDQFSKQLNWVIEGSKLLTKKSGQTIFHHKNDTHSISRSSYKFCNFNYECEFNYKKTPKKNNNGCFAQHFVHGLVYADIIALNEFINHNADAFTNQHKLNEIKKTVNTTSFVINHMYEELKNVIAMNIVTCNKEPVIVKSNRKRNRHKKQK